MRVRRPGLSRMGTTGYRNREQNYSGSLLLCLSIQVFQQLEGLSFGDLKVKGFRLKAVG